MSESATVVFLLIASFFRLRHARLYELLFCSTQPAYLTRKDAVIVNRLRIGHSRLTHSYLLLGEDQPTCESCGSPLTIKHLLLECTNLQYVCVKYFNVSTLKELFECVDKHNIIDFIKQTHFYHHL